MKLRFQLKAETKTCYRFERGKKEDGSLETIYLKKDTVAGIDPKMGLIITIEEGTGNEMD
jgi:hypothetical protein